MLLQSFICLVTYKLFMRLRHHILISNVLGVNRAVAPVADSLRARSQPRPVAGSPASGQIDGAAGPPRRNRLRVLDAAVATLGRLAGDPQGRGIGRLTIPACHRPARTITSGSGGPAQRWVTSRRPYSADTPPAPRWTGQTGSLVPVRQGPPQSPAHRNMRSGRQTIARVSRPP